MKKKAISVLVFFSLLLAMPFVQVKADDDEMVPLIYVQANQKGFLESGFVKRLLALSEWEPFFQRFTEACDSAFAKEFSRENLKKKLPPIVVDDIWNSIERDKISSRTVIEGFFNHVHSIIFQLEVEREEGHIDFDDLAGVLAFEMDKNPREGLFVLKYLRENKDYKFKKDDSNGDFIIDFDFDFRDEDIEFSCAGMKLPGENRYLLLLTKEKDVHYYLNRYKNKGVASMQDGSMLSCRVEEELFRILDKQSKRLACLSDYMEIFDKIDWLELTCKDIDGKSNITLQATMKNQEIAASVRDLVLGFVALAKLNQSQNSELMKLADSIQMNLDGSTVSLSVTPDGSVFWKHFSQMLDKATKEIQKRR